MLKNEYKFETTSIRKGNHGIMNSNSSASLNSVKLNSSMYNYQDGIKDIKILSGGVSAGVEISNNGGRVGLEATINILEFNGSSLKANLGISTNTGISINTQCLEANLAGFGVKFGKEIGITTSFGGISLDIETLIKTGLNIDADIITNIEGCSIIRDFIKNSTDVLLGDGDIPTNIANLCIKAGKEIGVNAPIGNELFCNGDIPTNIENHCIEAGKEIGGNAPIGDVLFGNGDIPTNIANLCIKTGKEIGDNVPIGDELFDIKDSIKTATNVTCNNKSLMTDIINCGIKFGKEIGINTSIGDESLNIGKLITTDILTSNKNVDAMITGLDLKVEKEISDNINTSSSCNNEGCSINVENEIGINKNIKNVVSNIKNLTSWIGNKSTIFSN
ncbi:988_t:CDS:1 [Cetraspora pellucida]|uniref:988_t:CDS:1 n=1 Tax=Cetraspora pellucida TaxID=1433469 RepID=A0A9N9JS47_9GLOM|nr:988_t:CDS:1 [Cetraspora pellucida]